MHRHISSGELVSNAELMKQTTTYGPELNHFRRLDKLGCFQISMCEKFRDDRMKKISLVLCTPFMLSYLGYSMSMTVWDRYRAGPPQSEQTLVNPKH